MNLPARLIRHIFHIRPHEPLAPFLAAGIVSSAFVLGALLMIFAVLAEQPIF